MMSSCCDLPSGSDQHRQPYVGAETLKSAKRRNLSRSWRGLEVETRAPVTTRDRPIEGSLVNHQELDQDEVMPWTQGSAELVTHALELLARPDSDTNRRIALIATDNAVEVMARVFLTLPGKPAKGLSAATGFYELLTRVRAESEELLQDVRVDLLMFFHQLRNDLYHGGAGLTVERKSVDWYGRLARRLFLNLFGIEAPTPIGRSPSELVLSGEFGHDDRMLTLLDRLRAMLALDSDGVDAAEVQTHIETLHTGLALDSIDPDVDILIGETEAYLRSQRTPSAEAGSVVGQPLAALIDLESALDDAFEALWPFTRLLLSMGGTLSLLRPLIAPEWVIELSELTRWRNQFLHMNPDDSGEPPDLADRAEFASEYLRQLPTSLTEEQIGEWRRHVKF